MQVYFMLCEQFIRPSLKVMRTLVIRPLQGYGDTAPLSYPDPWVRKPDHLHLSYRCHQANPDFVWDAHLDEFWRIWTSVPFRHLSSNKAWRRCSWPKKKMKTIVSRHFSWRKKVWSLVQRKIPHCFIIIHWLQNVYHPGYERNKTSSTLLDAISNWLAEFWKISAKNNGLGFHLNVDTSLVVIC